MMLFQVLSPASVLAIFFADSVMAAFPKFTPYSDAGCKNKIGMVDSLSNLTPTGEHEYLRAMYGVSGKPVSAKWYMSTEFPKAKIPEDSSAYNVWWKVTDVDRTCRAALMKEYTQTKYGSIGTDRAFPAGNVVLNAGNTDESCFFSSIASGENLAVTFCCGREDCGALSVGNDALILKRDVEPSPEAKRSDLRERSALSPAAHASDIIARDSQRGPLSKRDDSDDFDWDKCKVAETNGPWPEAGRQTLTTSTQTCTTASCSFVVSHGITVGTTLISTQDQSFTSSGGQSYSVTAGYDFIVKGEGKVEGMWQVSNMIGKSTGNSHQDTNTTTVTNTIGQALGTTGFVTFTPTYSCLDVILDCGKDNSKPLTRCNPKFGDDGNLQGDFTVVYI